MTWVLGCPVFSVRPMQKFADKTILPESRKETPTSTMRSYAVVKHGSPEKIWLCIAGLARSLVPLV